jgi:sugar phosphate permease
MYSGYAALILCRTSINVAAPDLVDDPSLGIDEASFGALLGWGAGGALAGKLINGMLADIVGGRRLFLFALTAMAAATIAFGLSSAHLLFMLLNFAAQLTKAGGWPAMAKIIGDWFDTDQLGRVWGVIATSSRASAVVSSFFLGAVLLYLPWRWVFYIAGGVTLTVMLCSYLSLRTPREVGLPPPQKEKSATPIKKQHAWEKTLAKTLLFFLKSRQVWLICLAMVAMTIQMELLSFLPLYFKQTFGIATPTAAMASAAFPAGSFISVLIGGLLYDVLSSRSRVSILGGLLGVGLASMCVLLLNPSFGIAIAATFVFGLAVSPAYYIPMSVFSIEFGRSRSGVLIGLIDAGGYGAVMVFAPIAGKMIKVAGWSSFLTTMAVISLLAMVISTCFLAGEHRAKLSS